MWFIHFHDPFTMWHSFDCYAELSGYEFLCVVYFLLNIVIQIEMCVSKIKIHYSMVSLSLDYLLVTGFILIDLPLCATLCFSLVAFKTVLWTYCLNSAIVEVLVSSFCLVLGRWWLLLLVLFVSVFHSKTSSVWVPLSLDLQNFPFWFYLTFSML